MKISRKLISFITLLFTGLICSYLFLHSSFFNVEKIRFSGLKIVSESELISLSGLSPGGNIFRANEKLYEKAIEIHPMVKEAKLIRHLPREIEIQVTEREVWALVPYNGELLCIDEEGVCLDRLKTFSLLNYPVITIDKMPERINLGQAVEPQGIKSIKEIWDAVPEKNRGEISDFHYINKTKEIVIYTNKGTEVLFGDTARFDDKIMVFNQISEMEKRFEEEGTVLEYIDLRFSGQPVVKTRV